MFLDLPTWGFQLCISENPSLKVWSPSPKTQTHQGLRSLRTPLICLSLGGRAVLKQKSRLSPDYSIYSESSLAGQQPSFENKYYSVETSHTKIYQKQRKIGFFGYDNQAPLDLYPHSHHFYVTTMAYNLSFILRRKTFKHVDILICRG
jgi:hypothetical protein